MALGVVASLLLTVLVLAFAAADLSPILYVGIAVLSAVALLVRAVARSGRRRSTSIITLVILLLVSIVVVRNYSLVRDHVRWLILSGHFKTKLLAEPNTVNGQLKHAEWDGWGFAGMNTTVFLAFDPTDSLAGSSGLLPPIKAPGIPCPVVSIHRLESRWYTVRFYTESYWGQDGCK